MIDYNTPTQDLLWIAKRLKGVLELAPVLEQLGSLENAINEANNRIAVLVAQAEELSKENAKAEVALEDSRKAKEATIRETELRVQEIQDKAAVEAAKAANALSDAAKDKVKKAEAKKAELDKTIADREMVIKTLDEAIADREKVKETLIAEIEAIKAKF